MGRSSYAPATQGVSGSATTHPRRPGCRLSLSFGSGWRNAQGMTFNRRAFLKQVGLGAAGMGLLSFVPGCRTNRPASGADKLPRSTPEAEGVSSAGILAFLEAVRQSKHELHSLMGVRHGRVLAEGGGSSYEDGRGARR